jgi:YHS domain-containing protein
MKKIIFLLTFCSAHYLFAQTDEARKNNFNVKRNLAIEGNDPVSYFDHKPTKGESKWTVNFKGVIYQFSSESNLTKFKANPEKYEPAYGGWCAYAMGESGEKVKVDPETFKIVEGKLYLFYNFWGNNTLVDWNKSEKTLRVKAEQNWKKILH